MSFDTSVIPAGATIESASVYLLQDSRSGSNPFVVDNLGAPRLDMANSFGAPEIEDDDASAPADASDVGCFVGSADEKYYALRIDLAPAALAAIHRDGITQFRLQFSSPNASTVDVAFSSGDAPLQHGPELREVVHQVSELQPDGSIVTREVTGTALVHRGLAEILGSARPFLDIRYNDGIFADGFESGAGLDRAR